MMAIICILDKDLLVCNKNDSIYQMSSIRIKGWLSTLDCNFPDFRIKSEARKCWSSGLVLLCPVFCVLKLAPKKSFCRTKPNRPTHSRTSLKQSTWTACRNRSHFCTCASLNLASVSTLPPETTFSFLFITEITFPNLHLWSGIFVAGPYACLVLHSTLVDKGLASVPNFSLTCFQLYNISHSKVLITMVPWNILLA